MKRSRLILYPVLLAVGIFLALTLAFWGEPDQAIGQAAASAAPVRGVV
jgi:hypothetical protein